MQQAVATTGAIAGVKRRRGQHEEESEEVAEEDFVQISFNGVHYYSASFRRDARVLPADMLGYELIVNLSLRETLAGMLEPQDVGPLLSELVPVFKGVTREQACEEDKAIAISVPIVVSETPRRLALKHGGSRAYVLVAGGNGTPLSKLQPRAGAGSSSSLSSTSAPGPPAAQRPRHLCVTDSSKRFLEAFLAQDIATVDTPEQVKAELARKIDVPLFPSALDSMFYMQAKHFFTFPDSHPENESMADVESLLYDAYTTAPRLWGGMFTDEDVATQAHSITGAVWGRLDSLSRPLQLTHNRFPADSHSFSDSSSDAEPPYSDRRPGYCLWVDGVLFLKAEYKAEDRGLRQAQVRLLTNMSGWNLPGIKDLPFVPCYAADSRCLQFYVIMRPSDPRSPFGGKLHAVSECFDLILPTRRIAAVACSFNMFRVLVQLRKRCIPELGLAFPISQVFSRKYQSDDSNCYVDIFGDHVSKVTSQRAPEPVYELLRKGVPGAIRLLEKQDLPDGRILLKMAPVCVQQLPASLAELRAAIRSVLSALRALHGSGFVHRDVRWPNVLVDPEGKWRLIDFELAANETDPIPTDGAIRSSYLPPGVTAGSPYPKSGDVYRVARLMQGCGLDLDAPARAFAAWLESAPHPTADVALGHDWLKELSDVG